MIADVLTVLIALMFVAAGYKRGLMRTFVGLISYVLSIAAAALIYPAVSGAVMKTKLFETITQMINKRLIEDAAKGIDPSANAFSRYLSRGMESVTQGVSETAAQMVVSLIAFIVVLIACRILVRLIINLFDVFSHLPVIKQCNSLGGAVFGGVCGVLVLYIIAAVLVVLAPSVNKGRIAKEIESSVFARELYENNVILNIVNK